MRIGIPKETKILEGRVGLIPDAVAELVTHGHEVLIEANAGVLSGYSDERYLQVGAQILPTAKAIYAASQMIIKVKEPQPSEWEYLRSNHLLFCYLHLAAEKTLTRALLDIGLTAVAFETVTENNQLPLLAPMSDIAGRIAAQAGCHYLHQPFGGKGILMGGLAAAKRGHAVVIGAGVAGKNASTLLAGMGVNVTVFDKQITKLEAMRHVGANVTTLFPYQKAVSQAISGADLVIGAVLIPGARAPYVVTEDMVRSMNPGSVIVDISVDQGGCVETTHPTNYQEPTYLWEGIVHFAVTNMPGAVPRTASQVLSAAITPFALKLTEPDWEKEPSLKAGLNVKAGKMMLPALGGS